MTFKKIPINPEKEYEAIRQQILKRYEFRQTILNITLTVIAGIMGFGLSNGNNLLILVIPPFVLLFSLIFQHNIYYTAKITCYLNRKFESDFSISKATYYYWHNKKRNWNETFLALGIAGLYLTLPIIAFYIGIINTDHSQVQLVLLSIDGISIVLIAFIFVFFRTTRLNTQFYKKLDGFLHNKSE